VAYLRTGARLRTALIATVSRAARSATEARPPTIPTVNLRVRAALSVYPPVGSQKVSSLMLRLLVAEPGLRRQELLQGLTLVRPPHLLGHTPAISVEAADVDEQEGTGSPDIYFDHAKRRCH
jgi:hypothetical protein